MRVNTVSRGLNRAAIPHPARLAGSGGSLGPLAAALSTQQEVRSRIPARVHPFDRMPPCGLHRHGAGTASAAHHRLYNSTAQQARWRVCPSGR